MLKTILSFLIILSRMYTRARNFPELSSSLVEGRGREWKVVNMNTSLLWQALEVEDKANHGGSGGDPLPPLCIGSPEIGNDDWWWR